MKKMSKKLIGKVVSDKMDKTRVVEIIEQRAHPLYQKTYLTSRRLKAHDEKNEFHLGDEVEIAETRPYAKYKAWQIIRSISAKASQNSPSLDGKIK